MTGSFQVTVALLTNCAIFSLFRLLLFAIHALAASMDDSDRESMGLKLRVAGLAVVCGTFAVLFQGPIYLTMKTMRRAFKASVGL